MSYRLRHISPESKMSHHALMHVFRDLYPLHLLDELLSQCQRREQREKKLNLLFIFSFVIAQGLFARLSKSSVLLQLSSGLRLLSEDFSTAQLPTDAALCYRLTQLGVTPLRLLFRRVCHPLATLQTPGAFALGKRLMAVDGTLEDVAETPANANYFGRHTQQEKSRTPFPQLRCLYLLECGTHAIVDAVLAPVRHSERAMLHELLRSVQSDMLVLLDRGLFCGWFFEALQQRGADGLARLSSGILTTPVRQLADGSMLVQMLPRSGNGLHAPLVLRVIAYRISDPSVPGYGHLFRLVTTLLDPQQAPAASLIALYHERWEIEETIDELKDQQTLAGCPLRNKTPEGVYQQMYGILLAHYALRVLMHEAACQLEQDPDRVSFTRAVQLVRLAVRDWLHVADEHHQGLKQRLLADLASRLLPPRILRCNERVVKQRFSKFARKREQHRYGYTLRQQALPDFTLVSAVLLI